MPDIKTLTVTHFFLILFSWTALAAEKCDPKEILVPDTTVFNSNLLVRMAYEKQRQENSRQKSSTGLDFFYDSAKFDFDQAQEEASYLSSTEKFSLSRDESIGIIRSTLSPNSVKAYLACIGEDRGVAIRVPEIALKEDIFQFSVIWDPKGRAQQSAILVIQINSGSLASETKVRIQRGDTAIFSARRQLDKPIFISASVEGSADQIVLPAAPRFTLEKRRRILEIRSGAITSTTGLANQDACINASTGSNLLPSTRGYSKLTEVGRSEVISVSEIENQISSTQVCWRVTARRPGSGQTYTQGKATFWVWEAYLKPIVQKLPARSIPDNNRNPKILMSDN